MNLSEFIDHTNLSKTATADDIIKLCEEAKKFHFPTVCVSPYYVKAAADYLKGTTTEVCTVIGFPNGYMTKETKQYEAIDAVHNGAKEIDMVININALKNKDYDYVKDEIETIRDSIDGKVLKVIIETCLLSDEEIIKMTEICNETFVNFIKTSTGFDKEGATLHAVELMAKHKGEVLEIKASGGIKTEKDAMKFIEAGATRIGTSHGVDIVMGKENK
jgi:deoxyribose-phosphate aldolase